METSENSPKKRGRKPKVKDDNDKIPKKRGRKPKDDRVYSVTKPIVQDTNNDEFIILHLPITQSDLDNMNNDSLLNYNPNNSNPIPYDPEINFHMLTSSLTDTTYDNMYDGYF